MDNNTLEARIMSEADKLGFVSVGIAKIGPSETFDKFTEWLDAGKAADMEYMQRYANIRKDPREITADAKSAIVCAVRYPSNPKPGDGFSTFARGHDYHTVIRNKLEVLSKFMRNITPVSVTRICVDSAPLLEREWAVRAGVGWRGKQGQILNKDMGCCLLLGTILTDVELQPSGPVSNECSECTQCIKSCPTGALSADGTVDANKCISYLTIEHKGDIDEDLQPLMGKALFGCDICTAICPWNKFGKSKVISPLREHKMPTADDLLKMEEKKFKSKFKHSTVLRTGLKNLQRNARIAKANGA